MFTRTKQITKIIKKFKNIANYKEPNHEVMAL